MGDSQPLRDVSADGPLLLTPEEAAQLLRVGRTTIYALINAGDLRPVHIGRSCRLARTELERYVNRLQVPPPARRRRRTTTSQADLFDVVHSSGDGP
ncbi:helix-turn-helix domain-containing protein [Petropleomorpha daqingensis]|uniref:Excisionase family DNA binding protein n=1 Tax=Petropleomorpha daqingensis TaxID=2026353 RepID=A0A853CLK9_9ACTN|nr:helix-turn-helix domain-containing protein [Petropleomorpha daqingensis]NYJ08051.1 excisionase family DNA binding protein [Petropleomorpha daqingensis]